MNIIKCASWSECEPLWQQWKSFKKEDPKPQPLNTLPLYIDSECINGTTTPKRTLAFIREDPSDPTTTKNILGCVIVYAKKTADLKIAGIGNMAIDPNYRKNGIASRLLEVCLSYIHNANFDISILWASVLKTYEKFGYIPLTRDHKETNMMVNFIRPLPSGYTKQKLLDINKEVGTW